MHQYPPAIWRDGEEDDPDTEWDDEGYEGEDPELANELAQSRAEASEMDLDDDGMDWEDAAVEEIQTRRLQNRVSSESESMPPQPSWSRSREPDVWSV